MAYITVSELRDEGFPYGDGYAEAWLAQRVALAQEFIENFTQRFFEPRTLTLNLDGTGAKLLWLPVPPVKVDTVLDVSIDDDPLEADDFRLIHSGLSDWRFNPKLLLACGIWPEGIGNVSLSGDFGFVEADGLSTPPLIKNLCKRIAIWNMPKLTDGNAARDRQIVEEQTGDFRYRLSEAAIKGAGYFNDPAITGLLARYKRTFMGTV